MAKFAANLTMLFTEVPFLERFERAHNAGFKAVEYLFPYAFDTDVLADKLQQYGFEQALFNMPPGDWDAGERGFAAIPGRELEFQESVKTALTYAKALNCKKVHAMSGIVDPRFTREQHTNTFINNIRFAADAFAKQGIELMIEPLNTRDAPNYFIAHQRQAADLIRQVERPNVKLQLIFTTLKSWMVILHTLFMILLMLLAIFKLPLFQVEMNLVEVKSTIHTYLQCWMTLDMTVGLVANITPKTQQKKAWTGLNPTYKRPITI